MFTDKTLLITGGTGTFGNAVLRRFLGTGVREVRVFSRDEKKQDDMRRAYADPKLRFYIGDVREPNSLRDAANSPLIAFEAPAVSTPSTPPPDVASVQSPLQVGLGG